ncbi:LOW QUALITY PROTEIN: sodium-dependent nutrient amino acid transporter 1-like, partial [Diaphorina citri]|uniref:LOW QUALITY PROTEIN: sodium-dependent nutrient amino acid transporter 1-like n=1 Tax=Diaphorina citri TaxID=121845 RepID=A0A3Q0IT57_DIACI
SNTTPMGSTSRLVAENQKNKESWKCMHRLGTTFVTLCLTASLGNILRLPRIVHQHGGGAFLIAYILVTIVLGIPLVFLEIVLGQFCQQGTSKLWRAVPLFRGVGFVKVLVSGLLAIYYVLFMALSLFYAVWSAKGPIPFAECLYVLFMALSLFYAVWSAKGPIPFAECLPKYTSSEFIASEGSNGEDCLRKTFLMSPSADMLWFCVLVTFLLLIWAFLVLCLEYPSLLSYFVCIVILFQIWYYAVIQFFFSTHVGFGNITTCAGRLYAKNNAFWTSVIYIMMSLVTGLTFVCIVYSWLHLFNSSTHTFQTVQMHELFVMTLIYDTMSTTYTSIARVWATLVFLVILLSGFVSTICLVYTVVTCAVVEGKNKRRWWTMTVLISTLGFLLTALSILPGDLSIVHILEHYVIGRLVLISTMLELIGFIWVYGLENLSNDFEFVLGYNLNWFWKTIWFIAPIILGVLEVGSMVLMPLTISTDRSWESTTGWIVYLCAWAIIIVVALWQILAQVDFDLRQKYRSSLKPTRNWGPVDPIYRHCWVQWKKQYQITGERDFTLRRRGTRDYTHSIKRGQHAGPVGSRYSIPVKSGEAPVYTIQQTPHSYIYDEAAAMPAAQNMYNTHLQSSVYVHAPSHAYYRDGQLPDSTTYSGDYTTRYNSPDVTAHAYNDSAHAYNDSAHAYNDDTHNSSQLYFMSNQADHVCWRKNQR